MFIQKFCHYVGSTAGSSTISDYAGQWEFRNWGSDFGRIQLDPLPFRSRRFSRNHQCVLVHGDRLSYRYGLCRLCGGFSFVVAAFLLMLYTVPFGERRKTSERELKITIPEDLDYPQLFDDIFEKFTHTAKLDSVRTTTMGSLYELRYHLVLKDQTQEKALIDDVRTRNGNLPVVLGKVAANRDEL